ncbi:MAG TPA: toll/interleukin-1 receptor domain-containing protein [Pyrinomonadaceae bacterium]|nr:toll/interleukin-1 receptor domain-containing protein [Pyrinomonadaceae bacterium]
MSDIFLSCAIDDGVTAKKLAAVFRRQGWTVWWDASTITPGANYLEAAMQELEHSKVVVVLWSSAARESRLVLEARKRSGQVPFVPVLLEKVELPIRLMFLPAFDLSDWNDEESHAGLQDLLRHVRMLIPAASRPAAPPASIEELSLSEIQKNARRAIKESRVSRPEDEGRFGGVFISYRRSEAAAYAGRLYDRLAARFGRERVFIDTENIGWGEDFVEAITSAAESCAVMIALISRGWSRGAGGESDLDDYVRREVATALGRKIRVIPILIQGASMPAPKELPEDLSPLVRRNALALSDTRWERDVEDLIKTLEGLLKD